MPAAQPGLQEYARENLQFQKQLNESCRDLGNSKLL